MENIEFIPAKDLPAAETNEVDVLCVENGELKRKAISLGGDTEYDLILRVVGEYDEESGSDIVIEYEVIQGDYEAVKQKIDNLIMPKVLLSEEFQNGDYTTKGVYENGASWYSIASEGIEAINLDCWLDLLPDNTVAPTRY